MGCAPAGGGWSWHPKDYNSHRAPRAPALTAAPGAEVGTGHRPQLPPPGPPSGPGTDPGERRDGRGGRDRAHCQAPGQDGGQEECGEWRRQGPRSPVGVGSRPLPRALVWRTRPLLSAGSPPRCRAGGPSPLLRCPLSGTSLPPDPILGASLPVPPRSLHRAGADALPFKMGFPRPGPVALSCPHPLRRCGIHPLPLTGRAALCAPLGTVALSSPHAEPPHPRPPVSPTRISALRGSPCAPFPPGEHPQPCSPVPLGALWKGSPHQHWLGLRFALGESPGADGFASCISIPPRHHSSLPWPLECAGLAKLLSAFGDSGRVCCDPCDSLGGQEPVLFSLMGYISACRNGVMQVLRQKADKGL